MPYLSKICINPLRRSAQQLLRNPQKMHAAVLGGMPPGQQGRVLWREEIARGDRGEAKCDLLVLTPEAPDWSHLVEQAGWATDRGAPLIRDVQPLLDLVTHGREFGFRVRLNPVQAARHPEAPTKSQRESLAEHPLRGVRVAHRTAGHQLDWFLSRTSAAQPRWGFAVATEPVSQATIVGREHVSFRKGQESPQPVSLARVTFEGKLTVTDPARLREVLLQGLGRGKAYGCGLLTLAPVKSHVVAS